MNGAHRQIETRRCAHYSSDMVGCSGNVSGQNQEPRLVRNNKIVGLLLNLSYCYKRVYKVRESHFYILDTFCHLTNPD
jgi:hypothetical protein